MRRLALALAVILLAGCSNGPTATSKTVNGPTGLGQPLSIDVEDGTDRDLDLLVDLAGQPAFRFHMRAGATPEGSVVPNVAKVYDGSIPRGTVAVLREGDHPELRFTVEDLGKPAFLLVTPCGDCAAGITVQRFDGQPGYD